MRFVFAFVLFLFASPLAFQTDAFAGVNLTVHALPAVISAQPVFHDEETKDGQGRIGTEFEKKKLEIEASKTAPPGGWDKANETLTKIISTPDLRTSFEMTCWIKRSNANGKVHFEKKKLFARVSAAGTKSGKTLQFGIYDNRESHTTWRSTEESQIFNHVLDGEPSAPERDWAPPRIRIGASFKTRKREVSEIAIHQELRAVRENDFAFVASRSFTKPGEEKPHYTEEYICHDEIEP